MNMKMIFCLIILLFTSLSVQAQTPSKKLSASPFTTANFNFAHGLGTWPIEGDFAVDVKIPEGWGFQK